MSDKQITLEDCLKEDHDNLTYNKENVKSALDSALFYLKELPDSALHDFCEHNIKKSN